MGIYAKRPKILSPGAALLCAAALLACGGPDDGKPGGGAGGDGAGSDGDGSADGGANPGDGDDGAGDGDGDGTSDGGDGDPPLTGFRVGAALVDISPTQEELDTNEIYLGGYGTPIFDMRPAEGVADAIEARAFAIEAEGGALLVAVLDVPGISNRVIHAIEEAVTERTGLERDSIWVGATHTHAGPDFQGLWGGVHDTYKQRVIMATADALVMAYEGRKAAELKVARGEHDAENRRDWDMTDRDVNVLEAVDADGKTIGTLVNFAAHPTVLAADNKQVSGDYCYYVRKAVSDALEGTPVLFVNGIMGDVLPINEGNTFEAAQAYGESVAASVLAAREGAAVIGEPALKLARTTWVQRIENTTFVGAAQAGLLDYDFMGGPLDMKVETQVSLARLGTDVQMLAFPGESLTRNGMPIKEAMSAPYRFFFGLTTDTLGYFVPKDEWKTGRNGDYEEGVSLGESAGDAAQGHAIKLVEDDNALLP